MKNLETKLNVAQKPKFTDECKNFFAEGTLNHCRTEYLD